jgi:hypothetical protein
VKDVKAELADAIREAANELEGGYGWPEYAAENVLAILGLDEGRVNINGLPTDPRVVEQVRSALLSYATNKISLMEAMRLVNGAFSGRFKEVKSA